MPRTFQEVVHALAAVPEDGQRGLRFCFGREGGDERGVFLSWPQIAARVRGLAARLAAAGLAGGDVVVVHAHDQQTALIALLAAIHLGAIPTAVAPIGAGTADRLIDQFHAIVAVAGPRLLVLDRPLGDAVVAGRPTLPPTLLVEDLVESDLDTVARHAGPEDPCFLQFTSGSTSLPKGVVVTQRMLLANLDAMSTVIAWGPTGRCVGWLPIYHDMSLVGLYGMCVRQAARGCFFPPTRFGRSPDLWLRLLAEERAILSAGPNFAFNMVLRQAARRPLTGLDLRHLQGLLCGSEPISADVMRRFAELTAPLGCFHPVVPSYGMAECTLMATCSRPGAPLNTAVVDRALLERDGRVVDADRVDLVSRDGPSKAIELVGCGPAAPGIALMILSDGRPVDENRVGEVLLAGDSVLSRYWNAPEANREAFLALAGRTWYRTGDLGFLRDGNVFLCGRSKDLIIHNGVNHYPADVEFALQQHLPEVVRLAAVVDLRVALADEFTGLGVLIEPGRQSTDLAAIQSAVAAFVTAWTGLPVAIVQALNAGDHLPRTTSGKFVRPAIRALLRESLTGRSDTGP